VLAPSGKCRAFYNAKNSYRKVLPLPPFTSFTFPITPAQSNFPRPRSRQRFFLFAACVFVFCLPPFSCRVPRKRRHFLQQRLHRFPFRSCSPFFVLLQPSYRENFKFSHSQFAVTNANDAPPTSYTIKRYQVLYCTYFLDFFWRQLVSCCT